MADISVSLAYPPIADKGAIAVTINATVPTFYRFYTSDLLSNTIVSPLATDGKLIPLAIDSPTIVPVIPQFYRFYNSELVSSIISTSLTGIPQASGDSTPEVAGPQSFWN